MTDEELLVNALNNTCLLMPPRLYYCTDLRRKHEWKDGIFMQEEIVDGIISFEMNADNELEGALGYRLATTKGINGAIALFYPGVQERLAELAGGDYFIGFTSIHEAIIHPVNKQSVENMRESIHEINNIFPRDEMLTDSVFRYHTKSKEIVEV